MTEVSVVSVGERGQIVVPKRIRDELGLEKGSKLVVLVFGDVIVMKKFSPHDVIRELREIFREVDRRIAEYGELSEGEVVSEVKIYRRSEST